MPTFVLCSAFMWSWSPFTVGPVEEDISPTHFLGRVHQALVAAELGSSKSPPCLVIMVANRVFSALPSQNLFTKYAATPESLHIMAAIPESSCHGCRSQDSRQPRVSFQDVPQSSMVLLQSLQQSISLTQSPLQSMNLI